MARWYTRPVLFTDDPDTPAGITGEWVSVRNDLVLTAAP